MSQTRDSVADPWGDRRPYLGEWPERVDAHTLTAPDRWVQSACVLCSNGCALDIGVKDGRIVGVRGRAVDRVNRGRVGPKGLNGWQANASPDRLTRPLLRRDGRLQPAGWDEAMSLIVDRSQAVLRDFGASAIGFYTSGQLFLEEYYTLAVIGKAGLGTPHMDGNTRLCTATAAAALKETFGCDGQPGSYADLDVADTILHVGHNVAETETVQWMRILDRRRGPAPPRLVVIDPRRTPTAKEADVHLAARVGTNVPVLNGLIHLIIEAGRIDRDFLERRTVGFEKLRETVADWTPERVEEVAGVPADGLRAAADILGRAERLVSTVLQGVYQSMQATAAAVQVNNLNLIRGMIGRPGCGILQMNGQPTAENTRECGADGDLPGFRNWENPQHVKELARVWNVDPAVIPHWAPPTHALNLFHHAETGSIRLLWISATNPAVSLPHLDRVRDILASKNLFVIVQDAFMTETAAAADVVLPAAIWGEKTGCFTNADRTVHISHKAVEPPGEARADLDIFLDYARRMGFRDKDGAQLLKWRDPEGAFEAWKECSKGRLCDYSGLSYEMLSGGSGVQWPCNARYPKGCDRLYEDGDFWSDPERCETYGHDLETGGSVGPLKYRANDPAGRAILKPASYTPPHERPDDEYPLWLTTGRLVHHFHTRTKTGRAAALREAAPEPFLQISRTDAERLGLSDGDEADVQSRRGRVRLPVRVGDVEPGHAFIPFHYGYWDNPGHPRAANELTIYEWDPVSKQPHYKYAAVRVAKAEGAAPPQPAIDKAAADPTAGREKLRRHVADYIGLLHGSESAVHDAFEAIAEAYPKVPDVHTMCRKLAQHARKHVDALGPLIERYGEAERAEPERLKKAVAPKLAGGGFGMLRDLHDVWLLCNESRISLIVLRQAAQALRDEELQAFCDKAEAHNEQQLSWLLTRIKQAAPQALVVPS